MIEKYLKLAKQEIDGKEETTVQEVDKAQATHVHKCYHDEDNPRPCIIEPSK